MANGVGAMVLFASEVSNMKTKNTIFFLNIFRLEYAILMASALNAMAKYALSILEFRRAAYRGGENAPPWENKSMWVFYVDLMTGERLSATAGVYGFTLLTLQTSSS